MTDRETITIHSEHPTHCSNGHPAMWCTCRTFRPAPNGTFTDWPMIRYPDRIRRVEGGA